MEDADSRLGPTVFVRLKPETEAVLRALAEKDERPLSTTIRRLVEEALAAREGRAA